jgi:hypothetical protein
MGASESADDIRARHMEAWRHAMLCYVYGIASCAMLCYGIWRRGAAAQRRPPRRRRRRSCLTRGRALAACRHALAHVAAWCDHPLLPRHGSACACVPREVWLACAPSCGASCATPCYAALCCAMLCYAALRCATLCYAVLCCAMMCNAMLCYAMLCHAVLCYDMLWQGLLWCDKLLRRDAEGDMAHEFWEARTQGPTQGPRVLTAIELSSTRCHAMRTRG